MAIRAAIDVDSFNANVRRAQTAVAPPFRRTEQADDRRAGGDRQMRRPGVAAYVNLRAFCQFVKTLQGKADRAGLARVACLQDRLSQFRLAGPVSYQRVQSVMRPQFISEPAKAFGAPKFCRPTAAGIEYGVIAAG